MTANGMKLLASLAGDSKKKDPFVSAIKKSMKSEAVRAHLLKPELEAAGYSVEERRLKVLTQVEVFKGGELVASGTSGDDEDALLQAALGYVKQKQQ